MIDKKDYRATVTTVEETMVAVWRDTLYRVGSKFEWKRAGLEAANHDGLILKKGKVYTAVRDHKGVSNKQAVLYYGKAPAGWRFHDSGTQEMGGQYVGIRGVADSRPLYELPTIDPEAEAECNICGHKTSIEGCGLEYREEMEDHVHERHIADGTLTSGALKEMYEVSV
jgi:hypothetical protein